MDSKLGVALEITPELPSDNYISRWLGEPVKYLIISTNTFKTNETGFPVLPETHINVIKAMIGINIDIIITGERRHASRRQYVDYINDLWEVS